MTTKDLASLEAIIRSRVCGPCEDAAGQENDCGRDNPDTCSLNSLFPEVARAVLVTDSDDVLDYVRAIREHVCGLCGQLRIDGTCDPREFPRCALEIHMQQVIDGIEEATGKRFDRRALAGAAAPLAG